MNNTVVSIKAFRDGMSCLGAAVNIVTSDGEVGRLGFTATAVCSVSDSPPSLLVCMNRQSLQNEPLKKNGVLCVNTLSAGREDLSAAFSGAGNIGMDERFELAEWSTLITGSPVLTRAAVSFDCRIVDAFEVNTHTVLVTEVLAVKRSEQVTSLIYLNRQYHHVHGNV